MTNFDSWGEYQLTDIEWCPKAPASWKKTSLAYLGSYFNGAAFKPEDWGLEGLPIIRIAQLTGKGFDNYFCGKLLRKLRVSNGDLLFSWSATIDSFIWNRGDAWLNQHIFRVVESQEANRKFLYYMIKSVAPKLADFDAHGSTMRHIKKESLKERVFVPDVATQESIALALDRETARIDALIEKKTRFIELLKEKRQALITRAVTKGLDPTVPMKDSGVEWIGEVPAHWEVVRVKHVAGSITSGPRGWSDLITEAGDSAFIQSGDLSDEGKVLVDKAQSINAPRGTETKRARLDEGDVLVCITGAKTGRVALMHREEKPAYLNQHLSRARPCLSVVDPAFLSCTLSSGIGRTYFDVTQYGLKQGLGLDDVRNVPMLLPPLPEQELIVEQIKNETQRIDRLATYAAQSITLLKERRSALITAAVTGQIDLREDAA